MNERNFFVCKLISRNQSLLAGYAVVESHIDVLGEKSIEAKAFADTKKWKQP